MWETKHQNPTCVSLAANEGAIQSLNNTGAFSSGTSTTFLLAGGQ